MKHLRKVLVLSALCFLFLASCSDDDNGTQTMVEPTIAELAILSSDLSTLVQALDRAQLVTTLQGPGPFTVFAPTNAAFDSFLAANNFDSLDDVPTDVLTQVLLNHVVSGENFSDDLTTGYISSLSTAGPNGRNLSLFVSIGSAVSINNAEVSEPNVDASNGVIHIVDEVIGLPTIVDHAVNNPDFSELVGALTANNNTTFTDLLSDTATNFTVFAPVNAAFTTFTNPNSNDIDNILSYHVLSGTAAFSDALMNMYVSTAGTNSDGDALSQYVNTDDGVTINGTSNVAVADVVAINGVVHAVDAVIDLPSVVTFATADPNFSTLVQALTELTPSVDFAGVLSAQDGNGDDPFTVFAPTNDAFAAITVPDEAGLIPVLQHHVLAGINVRSEDLMPNGVTNVLTLEGDILSITLPGTEDNIADVTDGAGNDGIGIIAVDVQANNGVIHVLNTVLLPDTTN
ncbi:hypothetical protein MTsPCn9_01140 [Croceitalea sp. MTPC9]|uniref:fasciclin domain-containing protein n=1 Tax=unclassified Croceitalea TaxID=2632280 RepID=UPI002B3EE516|nr:hypothetical protein MTsPCn6_07570 [Croceitalea sp. MTPC6]GMN15178.1 hypothetical protein MTsPCn9_01140 [Croceitalea sp. MTPC9]